MNKIAVVYLLFQLIVLVLLLGDSINVLIDSGSHQTAYGLHEDRESWFEKSVFNYIIGNLIYICLIITFIFATLKFLVSKGENKWWKILFYVSLFISMFSLFYGYFNWSDSGFDH